jgi:hypothetical protein
MRYDNSTKYKIIKELCNGKNTSDIKREYGIWWNTAISWLRSFAQNGVFDNKDFSIIDEIEVEQLRELAERRELELRQHGTTTNEKFDWILEFDANLIEWKIYAEEWIKTIVRNKAKALIALSVFFKKYLLNEELGIPHSVKGFVSRKYHAPDFYELLYSERKSKKDALDAARFILQFINWILEEKYSVEDDYGNKTVAQEFYNPLENFLPDYVKTNNRSESDKNVLPYRYIKTLRNILVPHDAICFRDLTFAQEITDGTNKRGDWYIVNKTIIDDNDADCVWRKRESSLYERKLYGYGDYVYELWSPAKTICLLVKLMLPLRTYQARMLDSGETDTFKYIQTNKYSSGEWVRNDSHLSIGTEDRPYEKGVLRKFIDPVTHLEMTGFYINTNKTADINKDETDKGYDMPWQYEEIQYWLAKLRDWQQKYNPIEKPTAWTELTKNELGKYKDEKILKEMGTTAFLFRNAAGNNKHVPIGGQTLEPIWYKLLQRLENDIKNSASNPIEQKLKFVQADSYVTTFYPLHSLRVSLITSFALEGGVPMPVLSKCIAGHARLVMTLYYTKMGVSYVTDTMAKAEKTIMKKEQESFDRFIKNAKYEQLERATVINDIVAYDAVLNAQKTKASIVMTDKGICPKGCFGCDTGGTYINDDTGKITYGNVQGYPAHNCVRCRWFITGPAFLIGLVNHFNELSYEMSEISKRVSDFQKKVEFLEDEKYDREQNKSIFEHQEELIKYEQLLQQETQEFDHAANNLNATLRLIDKCHKISQNKDNNMSDNAQLVPVGTIQDVHLILESEAEEMHQLQVICNGAELFPETDASKALLKRSQIIDLTLMYNNQKPVMFALSEEEQLQVGNQFMRILTQRAGSLKDAIPYAIGRKKLEEIGLHNEFMEEFKNIKESPSMNYLSEAST